MSLLRRMLSGPPPSSPARVVNTGSGAIAGGPGGRHGAPTAVAAALTIIAFLARRLGAMDRVVYERGDRAKRPVRDEEHRFLWGPPVPGASAVPVWVSAFAHLEGWADVFFWVRRDAADNVVGVDLLHPADVGVRLDSNREPVYTYLRKEYTRREIVHIPGLSWDGVRGVPPVSAGMGQHTVALLQERWQRAFYRSAATPSGIVSTADELDDAAVDEFYDLWDEQHGGPEGVGRVLLLQGDTTYTPVSMSPVDAQLLQSRQFSREEILGLYAPGLPHHLLGWKSNTSNFGTGVEQQGIHLVQHVFMPRLQLVSDVLSNAFLPPELRLWWDTRMWVEGDTRAQAEAWHKMRLDGAATREEWRTVAGLGPLDIPDEVLRPANSVVVPLGGVS